jgi:tetratricopeptide (TPR) repeat protein
LWRAKQAREWAGRATERYPERADHWNVLGVAHYRVGDYASAIDALAKAASLRPDGNPFGEFFLAMAHWRLGDKRQASEWYDKAVAWLNRSRVQNQDYLRYRDEASTLMGIGESPSPGAEKKAAPEQKSGTK